MTSPESPKIEILQDPFEQIPPHEQVGMEVASFLGALDDLFHEFEQNEPDRRADELIMQQILGLRNQASEHYSASREYALDLSVIVSQRLGEMACNHDHFRQSLEAATGKQFGKLTTHNDHTGHDHTHDHDDSTKSKKDKKHKKSKKSKNVWSWSWSSLSSKSPSKSAKKSIWFFEN